MKQKKISRKQISQFFNGENENRRFIAKQWMVKQILLENKFRYDDFYFLDVEDEKSCPEDKFCICRSVLINGMVNFMNRKSGLEKRFLHFFYQAPDWQSLFISTLKFPSLEHNLFWCSMLLTYWMAHDEVSEDLLREVSVLLIANKEQLQKNPELNGLLFDLLTCFVQSARKLEKKELLSKNCFSYLDKEMVYAFEKLALLSRIFPEEKGAAGSDIYNLCHLAQILGKEQETLGLLEQVISPYNADEICQLLMDWKSERWPQCLCVISRQPPLSVAVAAELLEKLKSFHYQEKEQVFAKEIVHKIAEQIPYMTEKLIAAIAENDFDALYKLDFENRDGMFNNNIILLGRLLNGNRAALARRIIDKLGLQEKIDAYLSNEQENDALAEALMAGKVVCE